jgi:hypothetical protein
LGEGKVEIQAQKFVVKSNSGGNQEEDEILFKVEPKEITTNSANSFMSTSLGGYKILSSFETNSIQGSLAQDLRLESRTKSVGIVALEDIVTNSKAGQIQAQAYNEITLKASDKIVIDAKKLEMKGLPKAGVHRFRQRTYETGSRSDDDVRVLQVCSCENGHLFVASASGACLMDMDTCLDSNLGAQTEDWQQQDLRRLYPFRHQ